MSVNKPDRRKFDREVDRIRRTYGGDEDWKDPSRLFEHYLYWEVREAALEHDNRAPEWIIRDLIALSKINKFMWDAVNHVARKHLARRDAVPYPLACWIADVLADQHKERSQKLRPRPRKGRPMAVRDRMMCSAIKSLVPLGFRQTRAGGDPEASAAGGSACDVVGAAFSTRYDTVEKIWLRLGG